MLIDKFSLFSKTMVNSMWFQESIHRVSLCLYPSKDIGVRWFVLRGIYVVKGFSSVLLNVGDLKFLEWGS